jgi:hypothetical protein
MRLFPKFRKTPRLKGKNAGQNLGFCPGQDSRLEILIEKNPFQAPGAPVAVGHFRSGRLNAPVGFGQFHG